MRIGYLYRRNIHAIAEPRQRTAATVNYDRLGALNVTTGDGDLQAMVTLGAWNDKDYYPARSHVNTFAMLGIWPEELPAQPLQPIVTLGLWDTLDNDPDLDYPATQGLMT